MNCLVVISSGNFFTENRTAILLWIISCSCGLAFGSPVSAKNLPKSTVLEGELKNFIAKVDHPLAQLDLPVAGRFYKESKGSFLGASLSVESARASLEIDSNGEVQYFVTAFSIRAKARREDIFRWIFKGTRLRIDGIEIKRREVVVKIRPDSGSAASDVVNISVPLEGGDSCLTIVKALGKFINFGSLAMDLMRLEDAYVNLRQQIEISLAEVDGDSGETVQFVVADDRIGLDLLIREAIDNRLARRSLLGNSSGSEELERELRQVENWQLETRAKMLEILPGLISAAASPVGGIRSYGDQISWVEHVRLGIGEFKALHRKCLRLGCAFSKAVNEILDSVDKVILEFVHGARSSMENGCNSTRPLSKEQLALAFSSDVPDSLIVRRLAACGISFKVDGSFLVDSQLDGEKFPETLSLLREAKATRPALEDLRNFLVGYFQSLQGLLVEPMDFGVKASAGRPRSG